jgi:hypothetical protein
MAVNVKWAKARKVPGPCQPHHDHARTPTSLRIDGWARFAFFTPRTSARPCQNRLNATAFPDQGRSRGNPQIFHDVEAAFAAFELGNLRLIGSKRVGQAPLRRVRARGDGFRQFINPSYAADESQN